MVDITFFYCLYKFHFLCSCGLADSVDNMEKSCLLAFSYLGPTLSMSQSILESYRILDFLPSEKDNDPIMYFKIYIECKIHERSLDLSHSMNSQNSNFSCLRVSFKSKTLKILFLDPQTYQCVI